MRNEVSYYIKDGEHAKDVGRLTHRSLRGPKMTVSGCGFGDNVKPYFVRATRTAHDDYCGRSGVTILDITRD